MKYFYLFTLLFLISFPLYAQLGTDKPDDYYVRYRYDGAGNRITKSIIIGNSPQMKNSMMTENDSEKEFFNDRLGEIDIKIYPNPTKGNLAIEICGDTGNMNSQISLLDMQGKLLRKETISESITHLDISDFIVGTYLLKIFIDGKTTVWKIIKE